jgi:hypothetical protein
VLFDVLNELMEDAGRDHNHAEPALPELMHKKTLRTEQ